MNRTAREAVWLAMSDLFLDTDVSLHRDYILRTLGDAPFTLEELDEIFIQEVFPVCIGNLHEVAGEWAGFSKKLLCAKIAKRLGKRPLLGPLTYRARWRHARRMVPEWFHVRAALVAQGKI